jgi:hypothetical protein
MPNPERSATEPSTAELLEGWRSAERSAAASERAAAAAERAAAAAERAAAATERVAEAAMATVEAAQASLDVVRASVIEARSAATASVVESADTTLAAKGAQDASEASRDRYQRRIADLGHGKSPAQGSGGADVGEKTDMSAVGDDGQVFGG